ncbi:MAG TPA: hypothetical protein VK177_07255 [Flavobacteriales bacterium]|nr:hypothetical protein [Flavobacteriales bacterium]
MNIENRKPVWVALSKLYLDTELSESDLYSIACDFYESPYDLEEIKEINKIEVFPVLCGNLLNLAGEWTGFDEDALSKAIRESIKSKTKKKFRQFDPRYALFANYFKDHFKTLQTIYEEITFPINDSGLEPPDWFKTMPVHEKISRFLNTFNEFVIGDFKIQFFETFKSPFHEKGQSIIVNNVCVDFSDSFWEEDKEDAEVLLGYISQNEFITVGLIDDEELTVSLCTYEKEFGWDSNYIANSLFAFEGSLDILLNENTLTITQKKQAFRKIRALNPDISPGFWKKIIFNYSSEKAL